MVALRTLSDRPELLVDDLGRGQLAPPAPGQLGPPQGPPRLGRDRLVAALPLNKSGHGPLLIEPWGGLVDDTGFLFGDPAGNIIGTPAIWIHRYLTATRSPQTRR